MTIAKGQPWGEAGVLPPEGILARSDREVRAALEAARRADAPLPTIGLLGGDLCRTVGGKGEEERMHGDSARRLPMDLGQVLLDGKLHWFAAHLVVRRSWWRGRVIAAMNAQFLGPWDVAPRSHPNDGRLDVFDADLSFDDRLKARPRLRSGTHVPHPGISERRLKALQVDLDRPTPVWLDGERVGSATTISLRVEPDAWTAVV